MFYVLPALVLYILHVLYLSEILIITELEHVQNMLVTVSTNFYRYHNYIYFSID